MMKCIECSWCIKLVRFIKLNCGGTRNQAYFHCGYPAVDYELSYDEIMDRDKPYGCPYIGES